MTNQAQNLSAAEIYAINFESAEPSYYTRIPNILSYLTYDWLNPKTGKIEVKRLSVYAKELYRELKDIGGKNNKCWMNRDNLAERCNMSEGMVTKCKEELCQKFHQLDLNPLIKITEKPKKKIVDGIAINGTCYHEITILNIWPWNNAFMATKKYLKDEAPSPHDSADQAPSPHDGAQEGALSPHDTNKNNNNKNNLFKQQEQPVLSVSSVSSLNKNSVFSENNKAKAHEWLIKNGCPEGNACAIVNRFCLDDIIQASKYSNDQFDKNKVKGKPLGNKWAYLQNVLNKRYWEKR
jgi:hypothetical protein